ncbi:MAG: HigA family addiction module antidote protein [Candidatus Competibacteraceae bacterium]|nr:HigA family addiction module antidote protein [Candidatus Competibacteraceae bacterium]
MLESEIGSIHPGEHLAEYLEEYGLSQHRLAEAIGVPPYRISEIVQGQRTINADTALRLGRFFGTSAQFWLNLQTHYDLQQARIALGERLERDIVPLQAA